MLSLLAVVVMYQSQGKAGLDDYEPPSVTLLSELYDEDKAGDRLTEVGRFIAETGGE